MPGCTSGSTSPLKPPPNCRNGTECGGTNEWTTWHDTTLPNSSCTRIWCNPGKMPYPPSKDIVGWEFKSGCNPGYGSGNVKVVAMYCYYLLLTYTSLFHSPTHARTHSLTHAPTQSLINPFTHSLTPSQGRLCRHVLPHVGC